MELDGNNRRKNDETGRKAYYSRLFRKFVLLTVVCSLSPLLLVGWGINIHYTRFAKSRMMNSFQDQVEHHRKIISLFLQERCSRLQIIAQTHSREYLGKASNLSHVFEIINREYGSINDIGIIDDHGRHLAYIGPYDLMDKNYSQTLWFRQVMEKGLYISNMFMGFRKVPHFIIAVTRLERGKKWILRATIDTEVFRSLVENVTMGRTGEVYLLNREGIFQTSPRFSGKIMEKKSLSFDPIHEGTSIRVLDGGSDENNRPYPRRIVAQAWLEEPGWILVVKQDYSEAFNAVNHANYATLIFLHVSALTILIVSIFISKYMIALITKRDIEADHLNKQLMQAGKLASVGELSAGVAHEINNPLAIILTERQILLDMTDQTEELDQGFREQLLDSLAQVDGQVQRCKRITHNLLRFSRRTKSVIETVDLNSFISEVVELMEREAKTSGIKFFSEMEEDLPPLLSDPSQLQQVFLNLITNAIDAHDGKSYGSIKIITMSDRQKNGVNIIFSDTGMGISPENLDKIFDPFFTTKPVGKGTGLGLSICYSIIKRLGGDIAVKSEKGKGTEFILSLPFSLPPRLQESIEDGSRD